MASFRDICKRYGADKGDHKINAKGETYADIYDRYFSSIRYEEINILELGVKGGASIAAYREYFPKARIYGIDIDPHCKEFHDPSKNIFIEIMSQTDESAINAFLKDTKFDIILDDASHVNKFTIASYNILNNRVKSNGIYIIEDLGCAYFKLETEFGVSRTWPGMSYNTAPPSEFNNDIADIHTLTNGIITKLDNGVDIHSVYSISDISFVHRYKYIMVIGKN
jgi:hypothetical protein